MHSIVGRVFSTLRKCPEVKTCISVAPQYQPRTILASWPCLLGSVWLDADEDFSRGVSTETIDDKIEASVVLFRGFEGFHEGTDAPLPSFCVLAMK